eukprot:TRINITY_DN5097_c0_g1_i1.p1 TRINITY_DN5097_c0_g1~~TRINITY_DN5097_c0_g1_i1.p1  ORF type:complete len:483 (-),score=59.70 TRINITY_DN5097_c0_g1_i1:611-2059(-)
MENHHLHHHNQAKKLTRTPSSLLRSPTVKSGIDSLSSLAEAAGASDDEGSNSKHKPCKSKSYNHHNHSSNPNQIQIVPSTSCSTLPYSKTSKLSAASGPLFRRLKFRVQLLLPPLVIVLVPCVWYYARPPLLNILVVGMLFDSFSALVFVTAVVISLKIAFPEIRLGFRLLPSMRLAQSWSCLAVKACAFLGDYEGRRFKGNCRSVTWTIGSTPERSLSKIIREGVEVFSNGDVYEGEFHQGKFSGSGVYYYYVNGRYEGDWVDGKYDGYGVETWARGSRYRGQYRQGLRHGYGVYRFYTGDVYAGEWTNGQSHGCGVQTCEGGSRYVGQFKCGVKHGLGYYHYRNGDTYAGEYFADKMHGFGVYNFANGHRYEGAWHEGKRQGLGMYTFRNGETQSGYWHQGVLQRPSTVNSQSGMMKAVNHANVLHAVQEARRAAAKAYDVPRVDERVNKAVAAANKAATAARVAAVKAVQRRMHRNVDV